MKRNPKDLKLSSILQENIEIPEKVQSRIDETCKYIEEQNKETNIVPFTRKHRTWKTAAAVVALCGLMSVGVAAATGVFSWNKVEEDNTTKYEINLDKNTVAHDLKVTPTYVVDGYVQDEYSINDEEQIAGLMEEDPSLTEDAARTKYELIVPASQGMNFEKRDESGKFIDGYNIYVYNASKLNNIMNAWDGNLFEYKNVSGEEETTIQGMDTRIFTWKDGSENETILMFNSVEGYMIQIQWGLEGKEPQSLDEMKKVAEGLQIEMLDTEVAYVSESEQSAYKEEQQSEQDALLEADNAVRAAGVDTSLVKNVGESFFSEGLWPVDGSSVQATEEEMQQPEAPIETTVTNVQVLDSVQATDYDPSHYLDYETKVAPVINEDGTLKPHNRIIYDYATGGETEETDIASKYVIATIKEKNTSDQDYSVETPALMPLKKSDNGNYAYLDKEYRILDSDYMLQWTQGMYTMGSTPIYFSEAENYVEVKGETMWGEHTLAAGEEREYTVMYAVDEDVLSNMVLTFAINMNKEFVDISQ